MFARVTIFSGPVEALEQGVETFREHGLPWMRDATGFRGWLAFLDREHEKAIGVSFWSDEAAMRDGVAGGAALRDEIAEGAGTRIESVEFYEVGGADSLALDELQGRPPRAPG